MNEKRVRTREREKERKRERKKKERIYKPCAPGQIELHCCVINMHERLSYESY